MKNKINKYSMFLESCISVIFIILGFIFKNINFNLSVFFFILSFILGGYKQAIDGIKKLIYEKKFNIEFLMILAAICSSIIGYWEEGAMLIAIFSISGALEEFTTNKNKSEINKLLNLQPDKVRKIFDNETIKIVPIKDIKIGDKLMVLNGDRVPIDGEIIEGYSKFDESPITGESVSKFKKENDEIYSGTLNIWNPVKMKVTKNIEETLIAKIIQMVKKAQNNPMKIDTIIEKIENIYVKIVLITVLFVIFLFPFIFDWSWSQSIYTGTLLLVVASPCALIASATPASLCAVSNAAKKGILIKGTKYLEYMNELKVLCFDKTGTLTEGKPKFIDLFIIEGDKKEIIEALLALERYSNHPLAKTIVSSEEIINIVKDNNIDYKSIKKFREEPGKGISGYYKNTYWKFGNKKHVSDSYLLDIKNNEKFELIDEIVIYIQKENKIIGFLTFADELRENVEETLESLEKYGVKTILLTGDNKKIATKIAEKCNIKEVHSDLFPEDKFKYIENIKNKYGMTAMVGDGINDSPSLAESNIGIAMGKGSDLAIDSANIILMDNKLDNLLYLVKISKKLNLIIIENIIFAVLIASLLIFATFYGSINLPIGVIGHEGSTILVILNGLRLLKYK